MEEPIAESIVRDFEDIIHDADQPIVMFAMEWCEFCFSVRKLFKKLNLEYRSVDIDSAPMLQNDYGNEIRRALREHTGSNTLPQIFIKGEFIGGCTETFDAVIDRSVEEKLAACGLGLPAKLDFDPYQLLPVWLHPR